MHLSIFWPFCVILLWLRGRVTEYRRRGGPGREAGRGRSHELLTQSRQSPVPSHRSRESRAENRESGSNINQSCGCSQTRDRALAARYNFYLRIKLTHFENQQRKLIVRIQTRTINQENKHFIGSSCDSETGEPSHICLQKCYEQVTQLTPWF